MSSRLVDASSVDHIIDGDSVILLSFSCDLYNAKRYFRGINDVTVNCRFVCRISLKQYKANKYVYNDESA